jgi:hypothetical protein
MKQRLGETEMSKPSGRPRGVSRVADGRFAEDGRNLKIVRASTQIYRKNAARLYRYHAGRSRRQPPSEEAA